MQPPPPPPNTHTHSEQMEKFAKRQQGLLSDTVYFSILVFSVLWGVATSPFTAFSYAFGAALGLAYSYGLSTYVASLGQDIDEEPVEGAGVGQARFAFIALLMLFIGKFRGEGLQELPAILGFFTYQLGSLSQGKFCCASSKRQTESINHSFVCSFVISRSQSSLVHIFVSLTHTHTYKYMYTHANRSKGNERLSEVARCCFQSDASTKDRTDIGIVAMYRTIPCMIIEERRDNQINRHYTTI